MAKSYALRNHNQSIRVVSLSVLAIMALMIIFLGGCKKEAIIKDPNAQLTFSVDTLLFDTIFTTVGSTTQQIKVFNTHEERIIISSIKLAGGSGSKYRINVDGVPGDATDIGIDGGDSLYIFVEVTLDPNDENTPMIVTDSIVFITNGNFQDVDLVAWGQDAYFHGSLNTLFILDCNEVWNNDKPHVIYGIVAVDSSCSLTINAGTEVYVHGNSGLYVYKGKLDVLGNLGQEVIFQGDRLEPFYQDIPGQWGIVLNGFTLGGIWLFQNEESTINHAVLKNGIIGIQVDTLNNPAKDALTITNTVIHNMSAIGLFAQGAKITGENLLITNCGQQTAALTIGGEYNFTHCTFANYWSSGIRESPSFVLSNYYEDIFGTIQVRPITNSEFLNCIIVGSNENELLIDINDDQPADYQFRYTLFKTNSALNPPFFENVFSGNSPGFISIASLDFHLTANAFARDKGTFAEVVTDLDGVIRDAFPDLGAYEYTP